MKTRWLVGFCAMLLLGCEKESFDVSPVSDYDNLPTIKTLTNEEGRLIKESDQFSVIITRNESGDFDQNNGLNRFVADNLPTELKGKKKVRIVFSGEVKPTSSQAASIGRPLKLTKIRLK